MILRAVNNIIVFLRMYRMFIFIVTKILMQNSYNTHVSHSCKKIYN